mmetsp:Transcript_8747/g.11018  ORF Transcript_8747/g.11018 Transcript_8747/m.11018 type:complete len:165 (+) Transcript_8747:103-597(+)
MNIIQSTTKFATASVVSRFARFQNRFLISQKGPCRGTSNYNNATSTMEDIAAHPVETSIRLKINSSLTPNYLQVINESHMHNVPNGSETHFKVVIVSPEFDGAPSLLKRHRMVNSILAEELEGPVHALSIVAKTPKQWEKMTEENIEISPSPSCRGGDGTLPKR